MLLGGIWVPYDHLFVCISYAIETPLYYSILTYHTPPNTIGYHNGSSNSCLRWQAVASAPIEVAAADSHVASR